MEIKTKPARPGGNGPERAGDVRILVSMGANLTDFSLKLLQILKGLRTAAGVPKDGGGMENSGHMDSGLLKPLAVFLGNLEVGLNQAHGGNPPQAHDDLGPDQGHLVAQVADAGLLLQIQRIPVLRAAGT